MDKSNKEKNQEALDRLVAYLRHTEDRETASTANGNGHTERAVVAGPTDEEVLEKCRAAENAAKFSDLFDRGDVHAHHGGDDSRADLALLSMLTFWTQDEAQLERIFSSSALGQRDKWRNRDDYRKRTIRKALAGAKPGEVYDWGPQRGRPSFSSSHSPLGL